jgi:hypothetical protein
MLKTMIDIDYRYICKTKLNRIEKPTALNRKEKYRAKYAAMHFPLSIFATLASKPNDSPSYGWVISPKTPLERSSLV